MVLVTGRHVDNCMADLVEAARRGDADAWATIVGQFSGLVWSIAHNCGLSPTDAADVSQTVWLRLASHLERIERPERVGAWLATTARRESFRVKKLSSRVTLSDDVEALPLPCSDDARSADAPALEHARDRTLWEAFATLPERDRMLLTLLTSDPPTPYREIAELLNMAIGSIGPTRARVLLLLRRRFEAMSESVGTALRH
jgi:RNA polymerase sigma factor (sigma-70 family)